MGPGVSLHVHRWPGSGSPVVLVHGLASNLHLWDGVAHRLAEAGHDVVAVDLRGHGRSDKPVDGYDVATVAGDLTALIEGLGLDRPLVAGQSWGGNVVVELAWSQPPLLGGVACVDGGWIELRRRFPEWEDCWEALAPPVFEGFPMARLESMLRSTHPSWPAEAVAGILASFEEGPDGFVTARLDRGRHRQVLHGLWEHEPTARYADVEVPVLLVPVDTGDTAWTAGKREGVTAAERLLPTSQTKWFEGDHDIHATHPDEVAALLHELAP